MMTVLRPVMTRMVPHDYCSVAILDRQTQTLRLRAMTSSDVHEVVDPDLELPIDGSPAGAAFRSCVTQVFRDEEIDRFGKVGAPTLLAAGVRAICCVPLLSVDGSLGTLNLGAFNSHAFTADHVETLTQVAGQIAIAVRNMLAYDELSRLRNRLSDTNVYLEREISLRHHFGEIIGHSAAIHQTLRAVETVAPTDATVLLLGETGTGKELLARAIHNLSARRDHTFVRLSAAALPTTLVESELFGYEKGAFTGATIGKVGRLDLANRGTLFLDEVGDLPIEVQPKLLRAIQEREFERLGSSRTQRVDVRFIAATNRDLAAMVAAGTFRSDLFYRLNVFPISVPALRNRREDIPALVHHFTRKYATQLHRDITTIPSKTMEVLQRWSWPGNIRELQNVIERAVILSPGAVLEVPLRDLHPLHPSKAPSAHSLGDTERRAILEALRSSGGKIGGPGGAAARLGIKRTTLQSKMRKLGITRPPF